MEYYFSSTFNRFFNFSRTEANSVYGYNVPCAVCMAVGKVTQVQQNVFVLLNNNFLGNMG